MPFCKWTLGNVALIDIREPKEEETCLMLSRGFDEGFEEGIEAAGGLAERARQHCGGSLAVGEKSNQVERLKT